MSLEFKLRFPVKPAKITSYTASSNALSCTKMAKVRVAIVLIVVAAAVVATCYLSWQEERLRFGTAITFGSMLLAVGFMVTAERASRQRDRLARWAALGALASCLGVCVGIAALVGAYFFDWPQWLTVCIAAPIGTILFLAMCFLAG